MASSLLLLLSDGRFPGGGHAHSAGLEAAVADGSVTGLASFTSFVAGRLVTAGAVDAWLSAAACAGADPLLLDQEADARCPSPALRQASRRLGRGLRRAAAVRWPVLRRSAGEAAGALRGVPVAEHHAVVQGLVARAAGLSVREAALLPGASLLAGCASALCRLLPVDAAEAMAAVADLTPLADAVAAEGAVAAHRPLPLGPVAGTPLLEVRAEDHARWEVRLFAS